jgi:hypothetical protein
MSPGRRPHVRPLTCPLKFAHYSKHFLDLDGVSRLSGDGQSLRVYFPGLDDDGDDAATCDANDISF